MATTVPQNMKPPQITGRHVPTRSSLRHSRMLVVNKNFKGKGFVLKLPEIMLERNLLEKKNSRWNYLIFSTF